MIYMGSKNRLSKQIVPIIQNYIDKGCNGYLEPFVGGANIIDKIECDNKIGSDIDKYVISVLIGLQQGIEPPKEVSKEFYIDVKNNPDKYSDFITGYIGYELSFGAKWFGGYAKRDDAKHRGDIYSYKSCMKQAPNLKGIHFRTASFLDYSNLHGYVIYCDPPYKNTTKYKTGEFPYEQFYQWCREMSKDNVVIISEYSMPDDFDCIWEKQVKITFDSNRKCNSIKDFRREKLFVYKNKSSK